jgi:hypothetical protein
MFYTANINIFIYQLYPNRAGENPDLIFLWHWCLNSVTHASYAGILTTEKPDLNVKIAAQLVILCYLDKYLCDLMQSHSSSQAELGHGMCLDAV